MTKALGTYEKVVALYKYTSKLVALKYRVVKDIDKQPYTFYLKNAPVFEGNLHWSFRDYVETEENEPVDEGDNVLFRIRKPNFQPCPEPPVELKHWLITGWDNFKNTTRVFEELPENQSSLEIHNEDEVLNEDSAANELPVRERFDDSDQRVKGYERWYSMRETWAEHQRKIEAVRNLFMKLYNVYSDLSRESETLEMMVGNGVFRQSGDSNINHPILLKRVTISLDAKENVLYICDTDNAPEIYSLMLSTIQDINHSVIKDAQEETAQNFYHPLDRNNASDFLQAFTHKLSSESEFIRYGESARGINSRFSVSMDTPVFFVRRKIDGTLKALELIIENIEDTHEFPSPIGELVSGGVVDVPDSVESQTIEEQLASANGENPSILLAKAANKEQLEIAERIEKYNAMLVQGPPGTGKTHTIANLIGHFLAQGKNVLVTSYSPKALSVLKEKLPKDIQHLCVSVAGDDNTGMVRSVDGISEFMARHTANEMKRKADGAKQKRNGILDKLADIRKKLYTIRYAEFKPIVFSGNEYSPKEAAQFVHANAEQLSYIPGKVTLYHELPVTKEELYFLYESNERVSLADEDELEANLPNPDSLCSPAEFSKLCADLNYAQSDTLQPNTATALTGVPNSEKIDSIVKNYITPLDGIDSWVPFVVADGKKGSGYRSRWEELCKLISTAAEYSLESVEILTGKTFEIAPALSYEQIMHSKDKILLAFSKGKPSKLDLLLNKVLKATFEGVKINGHSMATLHDCQAFFAYLELENQRTKIAIRWDELLGKNGASSFYGLGSEPEGIAVRFVDDIKSYLDWHKNAFSQLKQDIGETGLSYDSIFTFDKMDTEETQFRKIFITIREELPTLLQAVRDWEEYNSVVQQKENTLVSVKAKQSDILNVLSVDALASSSLCALLAHSVKAYDDAAYTTYYNELSFFFAKYNILDRRRAILGRIKSVAPAWSNAIKDRSDIHGNSICPDSIEDAWKWKQFAGIIDEITAHPFEELQTENASLSVKLREATAELATYKAWYHLLRNTESNLDMRQALQGWKMTVRKIGKGTGKNVPMYRRQAMEQMAICQKAVPAWIMPIGKAMDSLNPVVNKFDVIIVDEASQCDISSLGILYMAKKIIIVGDDKQVSPLAIGMETDSINNLRDTYIRGIIPNWHLYEPKTSLYDIAQTTFQPLMLREHFRCLPEIIGYSNKLSYDYKIKPLRDSGTAKLLPQVVNYRVACGERENRKKINQNEANAIVALIMSCIEQPEYTGMTFGVISLLGDQQAKLIQMRLLEQIPASVLEERRLLCGDASHFQGDERDIIFLSLVDSNEGDGPLRMSGEGVDASTKQRYNVAASRAKEQLWVVHSLDFAKDLKNGDMRRDLLEYASDPLAFSQLADEIERRSESPFEESVAKALVAAGYSVTQQYSVGAYRIDMVVSCGEKKIALECDGEAWHSSEFQIRSDMERQTILERIGWNFIRIRGSEYYCDPDRTMERVKAELASNGILPDSSVTVKETETTSDLLERVKINAQQILDHWNSAKDESHFMSEIPLEPATDIDSPMKADSYFQKSEVVNESLAIPPEIKSVLSAEEPPLRKEASNNQGISHKKKPERRVFTSVSKQITPGEASLMEALDANKIAYIDNRATGSFLWVLNTPDTQEKVVEILEKSGLSFTLEKRGAVATGNKPAFRVR